MTSLGRKSAAATVPMINGGALLLCCLMAASSYGSYNLKAAMLHLNFNSTLCIFDTMSIDLSTDDAAAAAA
mgnify:CR=1 FL=1